MHSKYFENLNNRILILKRAFIPKNFSPTGNYKQTTYEKARAFKILSHTEFEVYFEEICLAIAKKSYSEWDRGRITKPLLAMVLYYSGTFNPVPESINGNNSKEDISKKVHKAFTDYNMKVKSKNNGIKQKDILKLFLPIGIEMNQLDNDLIIALDSYGAIRGQMVHTNRATYQITPEDALNSTLDLINHIAPLDEVLNTML